MKTRRHTRQTVRWWVPALRRCTDAELDTIYRTARNRYTFRTAWLLQNLVIREELRRARA